MKKSLSISAFLISIMLVGFGANSQSLAYNRNFIVPANPYPEAEKKIVSETDVNINAARDFRKTYRHASDIKWVLNDNGASVYFVNDGIKMRSSYNGKGRKEYTLKYYDETKMPMDLRQRVKNIYYYHNILMTTEVTRNNQTYYLVKMENEKEFLTIKISDDDMSVFEQTVKIK
jgi:hypothetical protein